MVFVLFQFSLQVPMDSPCRLVSCCVISHQISVLVNLEQPMKTGSESFWPEQTAQSMNVQPIQLKLLS